MVVYSTLEEAYPNDDKYKKPKNKSREIKETKENKEKFINDYGNEQDCYYSSIGINTATCPKPNNPLIDKFSNKEECKPLQAPQYKLPIDSNAEKQYNKAIKTSLSDTGFINDFNRDGVKPYDFDEMDAYLNVVDIKTNNKDTTPEYRTTPFLEEYLKTLRDNFKKPLSNSYDKYANIEQFTGTKSEYNNSSNSSKSLNINVNIYNFLLFVFLGIILILSLDQITKLIILSKQK